MACSVRVGQHTTSPLNLCWKHNKPLSHMQDSLSPTKGSIGEYRPAYLAGPLCSLSFCAGRHVLFFSKDAQCPTAIHLVSGYVQHLPQSFDCFPLPRSCGSGQKNKWKKSTRARETIGKCSVTCSHHSAGLLPGLDLSRECHPLWFSFFRESPYRGSFPTTRSFPTYRSKIYRVFWPCVPPSLSQV